MLKLIKTRLFAQTVFFFLQNPFIKNFFTGEIYRGSAKRVCTPGLNCYSCPAAAMSCPIGAAQLFFAGAKHSISLFVTGILLTAGMVFGRFICGYVCPMGFFQDFIYKIKTPKLRLKLKIARYVKYVVLAVFVIVLPMLILHPLSGLGEAWFCKYICPMGTIFAAFPILASNEALRSLTGGLFAWKTAVALAIIGTSAVIYRFFCRVICPLGAVYSLFNGVALVRMGCDRRKCTSCNRCEKVCNICITPATQPNSPECMRCGNCVRECGGALKIESKSAYDYFSRNNERSH
ncbi:MAG: 4Fe-4S binding protein [Oscillospiraceae bacterium]|nr:4Fe-4S binding protein [Oscillospiraceae bacterium]